MAQMYSEKQKKVIKNANARWNILTGAVRSGKSFIANDLLVKRLQELPEGRRAIIGKTETTIMRNILDPLQDRYGVKYVSDIQGKKREATIFGNKLYCIGANDARAVKKLQGTGFQYVLGDEITTWPQDFFSMLKSRLDKNESKLDGTCNPEGPYHWLKQEIIDQQDELDVFHQHFTIDDNPFLSPEFVKQLKKEYSGVWYQRYIKGLWVLAEGLVYDMFDNDVHIVDDLPDMTQHWIGIDYGTANDTVFLLLGLGTDNRLYVIDEWRWGRKSTGKSKTDAQLREKLQEFIIKNNVKPKWIFIDPSAASFITELYQHRGSFKAFNKVYKADNTVLDGIQRVSSLLGAEKLFTHKRCEGLREEMMSYSWDPKAQERGKDEPLKEHDHGPDALRYIINGILRIYNRLMKTAA